MKTDKRPVKSIMKKDDKDNLPRKSTIINDDEKKPEKEEEDGDVSDVSQIFKSNAFHDFINDEDMSFHADVDFGSNRGHQALRIVQAQSHSKESDYT